MNIFEVPYRNFINPFVKKLLILGLIISFNFSFGQTQSKDFELSAVSSDFKCSIYPNPSKDHIFFTTLQVYSGLSIAIINANGQNVKTINPKEKNTVKIDISQLPNGMYFMTIRDRKEILGIRQFIISK